MRIIPARAGQTPRYVSRAASTTDHPRACGANLAEAAALAAAAGSSPRVRGKPRQGRRMDNRRRIIPARAGQTRVVSRLTCVSPDHPRACGANLSRQPPAPSVAGSSPRVRGKPVQPVDDVGGHRIIPARAGQTPPVRSGCRWVADHPRACGANCYLLPVAIDVIGSSPRVRGKRDF